MLLICPHGNVEKDGFHSNISVKYFSFLSPIQTLTICLHVAKPVSTHWAIYVCTALRLWCGSKGLQRMEKENVFIVILMHLKHLSCRTHRRSWLSFLSRRTRGTHGNVSIKRTNSSTCSFHWVCKGGHLLQNHFLTDFDHMLSWECLALWKKSSPHPSLKVTLLKDVACWSFSCNPK